MESPTARAVVLVRFPFSDLSESKYRPALIRGDPGRGDFILCQISSDPYADSFAVELTASDFTEGSLPALVRRDALHKPPAAGNLAKGLRPQH